MGGDKYVVKGGPLVLTSFITEPQRPHKFKLKKLKTVLLQMLKHNPSFLFHHQGYYDTMDAGFVDEEGFLYIMSRSDDVINVAGHRLSAGALEEVGKPLHRR